MSMKPNNKGGYLSYSIQGHFPVSQGQKTTTRFNFFYCRLCQSRSIYCQVLPKEIRVFYLILDCQVNTVHLSRFTTFPNSFVRESELCLDSGRYCSPSWVTGLSHLTKFKYIQTKLPYFCVTIKVISSRN